MLNCGFENTGTLLDITTGAVVGSTWIVPVLLFLLLIQQTRATNKSTTTIKAPKEERVTVVPYPRDDLLVDELELYVVEAGHLE